jgi:hypothetical protein
MERYGKEGDIALGHGRFSVTVRTAKVKHNIISKSDASNKQANARIPDLMCNRLAQAPESECGHAGNQGNGQRRQ